MGTKSPIRAIVIQVGAGVLIAGAGFGVIRFFFPQLLVSLTSPPKLLEIEPSSTFSCKAHQGDVVIATFNVRNVTHASLELLGLGTSCGCTTTTTDFPIHLAPGATVEVNVKLTVGEPGSDGKFEKVATLFVDREGVVPSLVLEATVVGQTTVSTASR